MFESLSLVEYYKRIRSIQAKIVRQNLESYNCICLLQSKREAFDLPDGADLLVGSIRTNFACPQGAVGYFADTDNDCKIFHVCNTVVEEDDSGTTQQYSFLCGNQTVSFISFHWNTLILSLHSSLTIS